MKRVLWIVIGLLIAVPAVLLGLQFWHTPGGDLQGKAVANAAQQIARGAYLAQAGNCMTCHTARGGAMYAGGRAIQTPFGDVYASNITPDLETGIGKWSADDFWRALHNGKSRDGRLLYPAFPYTSYTKVTREDSDALFAYLRTLAPARQANQAHALRFPYDQQLVLAGWRALYFRPGVFESDAERSAQWNRGAYLVEGLGHCSACHAERDRFGATLNAKALQGGLMPGAGWYAPRLHPSVSSTNSSAQQAEIKSLLKTGVSERGAVFGPMAEVVRHSLQHLTDTDIDAMTTYLMALPPVPARSAATPQLGDESENTLKLGGALYEKHCAECHGAEGQGEPRMYPALAGNGSMLAAGSANAILMVLHGGYAPSTAGNPKPFGMPPYGPSMTDAEVAAVVSFIGTAWGNQGELVSPLAVARRRGVPVD